MKATQEKTIHREEEQALKKKSMFVVILERLSKNKTAMFGLIVLLIIILLCVCAPLIAPYSPTDMDYKNVNCLPNSEHWFGCDNLGRDILSRILYGGTYSLGLGFASALVTAAVGLIFGSLIGYAGGKVDMICMRLLDIQGAIPGNLLAILISSCLGSGYVNTIIAMTVGGFPSSIRSTRSMCLKEREMEYLEAAKSINCSTAKIMYKHMLPNIVAPTIIGTTMSIGNNIMGAAGLSFIGLGVRPPTPEWGAMLSDARGFILQYPHMLFFPGLAIAIVVFCVNLFGDGLRDAMDPRLKT